VLRGLGIYSVPDLINGFAIDVLWLNARILDASEFNNGEKAF
jgi:hypothetical protein